MLSLSLLSLVVGNRKSTIRCLTKLGERNTYEWREVRGDEGSRGAREREGRNREPAAASMKNERMLEKPTFTTLAKK